MKMGKPLFTCDVCGTQAHGFSNDQGRWFKPHKWFQRTITKDEKKITQVGCSRDCIRELGGIVAPW